MAKIKQTIGWGIIITDSPSADIWCKALSMSIDTRLVAVAGSDKVFLHTIADKFGIKHCYDDVQMLFDDKDVDAVLVVTPASTHVTYAMMAMRGGKPVCVTAPLSGSYDECSRLNRVSKESGMPCFVTYYRRYMPYFAKVKSLLQSGVLGQVLSVDMRLKASADAFSLNTEVCESIAMVSERDHNGLFYVVAPQQLDIVQELFGVIVKAHGYQFGSDDHDGREDALSACLRFSNGVVGNGRWTFTRHATQMEDVVEVTGSMGTLQFSVYNTQPIQLCTAKGVETFDVEDIACPQLPFLQSMNDHIRGIGHCECNSISATAVNWVMDRILWKV